MAFDRKKLFDVSTHVETTMGGTFQEGNLLIVKSQFEIWKAEERQPSDPSKPVAEADKPKRHVVLYWRAQRLNEDAHTPLVDPSTGDEIFEDLRFGLGGQSLERCDRESQRMFPVIHPGRAESPTDENIEDAGGETGAFGPTIKVFDEGFAINTKSAFSVLSASLQRANLKPDIAQSCWAPYFENMIVYMKSTQTHLVKGKEEPINDTGRKTRDGKPIYNNYRIVTKIVGFKQSAAAKTKASPAATGVGSTTSGAPAADGAGAVEDTLRLVLEELNTEELRKDPNGVRISVLKKAAGSAPAYKGLSPQDRIEFLKLLMNPEWMANNAEIVGFTLSVENGKVAGVKYSE